MSEPKLRFKRDDWMEYPEWETKRQGDICVTFSGGTPKANNDDYYNGNINFIRSGEIHSEKTELTITEEGFNNSAAKIPTSGKMPKEISTATCVMAPGVILAGDLYIVRNNVLNGCVLSYV